MTYLDVEPVGSAPNANAEELAKTSLTSLLVLSRQVTGFTLGFAKRIQINMMYGPSQKIT